MNRLSLITIGLLCSIGYLAAMESTLEIKACDSWTPLHSAVFAGNSFAVKTFLEEGARIEARTSTNETPLILSAKYNRAAITRELLAHGAKVDQTDKKHNTALHIACKLGHVDVVEILISAGASIEDDFGEGNALQHAFAYQNYTDATVLRAIQKGLRKRRKIEAVERFPLHEACQRDDHIKVTELVLAGCCPKKLDTKGNSAMHYAALNKRYPKILNALLTAIETKSEATQDSSAHPYVAKDGRGNKRGTST